MSAFADGKSEVIRGKAVDVVLCLVDLETITAIARAYEQSILEGAPTIDRSTSR